jgi:protein CpxP
MKKYLIPMFLVVTTGFIAMACNKSPEEKAGWVVGKISRNLNLSAEQKQKLVAVKKGFFDARARRKQDKEELFQEVARLIRSEQLKENEVSNLMERKNKMYKEELPGVFALLKDFHGSLSTEQKEKAATHLEKFKKRVCQWQND